jgi:hypothetical protein
MRVMQRSRPSRRQSAPAVARAQSITNPNRHTGRCDGGRGPTQHSGLRRSVAELVIGASRTDRVARGQRTDGGNRACARPSTRPLTQQRIRKDSARFFCPRNHHFGRLHNRQRFVTPPQLQFIDCVARDDCRQMLVADAESNLCEKTFDPHFFDNSAELISAAERNDHPHAAPAAPFRSWPPRCRQQPIDFCI